MLRRILVPRERMAVIIGRRGSIRKSLEKKTGTHITMQDDVQIEGDAINVLLAESVIAAVGRGFSPENAMILLDEENTLDKEMGLNQKGQAGGLSSDFSQDIFGSKLGQPGQFQQQPPYPGSPGQFQGFGQQQQKRR